MVRVGYPQGYPDFLIGARMHRRVIIPSHPSVIDPHRVTYDFRAHSHKVTRISPPQFYSILSDSTGKVTLVEYRDRKEFDSHRERIARYLAAEHLAHGRMQGCKCPACK